MEKESTTKRVAKEVAEHTIWHAVGHAVGGAAGGVASALLGFGTLGGPGDEIPPPSLKDLPDAPSDQSSNGPKQ